MNNRSKKHHNAECREGFCILQSDHKLICLIDMYTKYGIDESPSYLHFGQVLCILDFAKPIIFRKNKHLDPVSRMQKPECKTTLHSGASPVTTRVSGHFPECSTNPYPKGVAKDTTRMLVSLAAPLVRVCLGVPVGVM